MGRFVITQEEFERRIRNKHGDNIIALEKFNGILTKIKFRCNVCTREWITTPHSVTRLTGCPDCGKKRSDSAKRMTQDEFEERVLCVHHGVIEPVEKYINTGEKIKFRCKICCHEWRATPNNITQGKGCPKCADQISGDSRRLSLKDFEEKVKKIHGNTISVIGGFDGIYSKPRFRCNVCGNVWKAAANNVVHSRRGCPNCISKSSGENEITKLLIKSGLKYEREVTFDDLKRDGKLRYDFAVYKKRGTLPTLIEFDGIQHFEPVEYFGGITAFEKLKESDKMKNDYAKKNGMKLIRIPYYDILLIPEILENEL